MDKFNAVYGRILAEEDNNVNTIGIFPGAFKPPHIGHYHTALDACKQCDSFYIFVSSKSRPLSTTNKAQGAKDVCDSDRYANIFKSEKFIGNLLSVQPAACARMTSATAFRTAMSVKDKNTIIENLPQGADVDKIFDILMRSNDIAGAHFGHVTVDQAMQIWQEYIPLLSQQSGMPIENIILNVSEISPVKDTYDLVGDINNSEEAGMTSIKLYVGT